MGKHVVVGVPQWAPTPPMQPISKVPIVWPKMKQPIAGWMLAEHCEGCWGHWVPDRSPDARPTDGQTLPCVGRKNGCLYCGPHFSRNWKGYMPMLCSIMGRIVIAQITKEAARNCPPLYDPRRSLRGHFLRLERVGQRANGIVQAEVCEVDQPSRLPQCPSIRAALEVVWNLRAEFYPLVDLVEGTANG